MSALAIFRKLTSVPTAPFFEKAVTAQALSWINKSLGRHVKVRRHKGGVEVRYEGAGKGPALAFAAHLDHPAFDLKGNTAVLQGGLPQHLLKGARVQAHPAVPRNNTPIGLGVLGEGKNGVYPVNWLKAPGRRAKFLILDLPPCRVSKGWVQSRSIDDLMGCAVSLEALRRLVKARVKTNATVFLHRAEEVGFVGALDLIRTGAVSAKNTVLSIETSRELPGARPGKGPVIRLGDKATIFDGNAAALLDAAAKKVKKVQRLRLTGGTCEATAYLAWGFEAGGAAVPLVNYHNGWGAKKIAPEMVRKSDVDGLVKLLVEAARLFPKTVLRGALRGHLEKRHDLSRRRL